MPVTQKEIPTKYCLLIYFKLASRNFSSSSEKETEEVAVFNSWYVCIGNKNLGVRKWDPFKMHCSNTISERAAQHQKNLKKTTTLLNLHYLPFKQFKTSKLENKSCKVLYCKLYVAQI